ncbi:MAG: retroviral-like aspartic protease family protein [Cyanosarcina radialis HA8281-LM2]|jgi:predicted aspartyl protease|nr:retroviral-like aspartic protease family protein [Cyanosarcina radialis HA8281-LM2]
MLNLFSHFLTIAIWSLPLSQPDLAIPRIDRGSISLAQLYTAKSKNFPIVLSSLQAIVHLEGLKLPKPQVRGQAIVPLELLPSTPVFILDVNIGDRSRKFLLDTGASTTMLSSPLVQQLGLKGEPISNDNLGYAVAGNECPNMNAILHRLPKLNIDRVQIEKLRGLEFTNTIIPPEVSGVLGMDVLSNFDLKLNPQSRQLELLSPSTLPKRAFPQAILLRKKLGVMLTQVKINDRETFTFMLDTGAGSTYISQRVARQTRIDPKLRQPIQIRGFCGLENAERSKLSKVSLKDRQVNDIEAIILSSSSILDLLKVDGILGQNFFNNYQQHWRFTSVSSADGSLILTPISQAQKN